MQTTELRVRSQFRSRTKSSDSSKNLPGGFQVSGGSVLQRLIAVFWSEFRSVTLTKESWPLDVSYVVTVGYKRT